MKKGITAKPGANFMSQKFRVKFLLAELIWTLIETSPFFLPSSKLCQTSELFPQNLRVNIRSAKTNVENSVLKFREIPQGGILH